MFNMITFGYGNNITINFEFFTNKGRYYVKKIDEGKITTCKISRASFKSILKQEDEFTIRQIDLETVDGLYSKTFFNETEGTFDEFLGSLDEYFDFCEDINNEKNEKIFNEVLIRNTKNNINKNLPTELVDMIISFL